MDKKAVNVVVSSVPIEFPTPGSINIDPACGTCTAIAFVKYSKIVIFGSRYHHGNSIVSIIISNNEVCPDCVNR